MTVEAVYLVGKRRGFSESMARFHQLLFQGLESQGHHVREALPPDFLSNHLPRGKPRYWAEYFEQYVLFPRRLTRSLARWAEVDPPPERTIVHLCDHSDALVTRVLRSRPHSATVHDCIPRRVISGEFSGVHKGRLGRLQQRAIYEALGRIPALAAISDATAADLCRFLQHDKRRIVRTIPNGPSAPLRRLRADEAERRLAHCEAYRRWTVAGRPPLLLLVGANVFYKNREGAMGLAKEVGETIRGWPWVLIVGPPLDEEAGLPAERLMRREEIPLPELEAWYSVADVLLFPSLAEGFGWPLLEAQQTGCMVLTTDLAPMNEVAGPGALLLPVMPASGEKQRAWRKYGASQLRALLAEDPEKLERRRQLGYERARRYSMERMISGYLEFWDEALAGGGERTRA